MASDLLPNLEDGELWLPSDIIGDVGICHHHHRLHGHLTAIDDLTHKVSSFGLLDNRRSIPDVKSFKVSPFYPNIFSQGASNGGHNALPGENAVAAAAGRVPFFPASQPVHEYHPRIPVDGKVVRFRLERARVLWMLRHQYVHALNRFVPVRSPRFGRECGGTGVFLPRVSRADSNRKHLKLEESTCQFQLPTWNPMAEKKAVKLLPSSEAEAVELSLPQDWTY